MCAMVLEGFTAIDVGGATRGEKAVQESLPFAYDCVEAENNNKEVLEMSTCNHMLKPGHFMDYYNYRRMHQEYKLKQNGFRKPAEAHFSNNLTLIRKVLT